MTEVHAGYRVPLAELDEIPMDNRNTRVQNSRPTGQYQRRLDAENYWNFVIQHRLAVVVGTLCVAIVIALIAITTYLTITPNNNYTTVEINRISEVATEEAAVDELEDYIGNRFPILKLQDEVSPDMLDALLRETYQILPAAGEQAGRMERVKREIEEASVESCKKRHENCQVLLHQVKNMTKNVAQQVRQLQKMINRLGIRHEELPTLQNNITALDFATCLVCQELENQTVGQNVTEIQQYSDSTQKNASSQSEAKNLQIDTKSIQNDTVPSNNEESIIKQTDPVVLVETSDEAMRVTVPPRIEYSKSRVNVTRQNISMVENPEESKTLRNVCKNLTVEDGLDDSHNKTLYSVANDDTVISNSSSDLTNSSPTNRNDKIKDKDQNNEDDFFFHHSQFNGNSAEPLNKPEVFHTGPSTLNVIESIVSTTENSLAVLTTIIPENNDQSILTTTVVDQSYLAQGRAHSEPNPFIIPTAETTKTSQQVTYTPGISWMPYPLCVYGPPNPPSQSVRQKSSESITFPVSPPAFSSPSIQQMQPGQSLVPITSNEQTYFHKINFIQPFMPVQPVMQPAPFVPMQFQPTSVPVLPQRYGPTGPATQYIPVNQAYHQSTPTAQGRPIYCTYLPAPAFQFPVVPGVSEFQRAVPESGSNLESVRDDNNGLTKFTEQELKSRDYAAGCPPDTRACGNQGRCIPKLRWCDGEVDCEDASDETRCSCRDRVDRDRICDGYFDCPLGEDELGCFGCDRQSFSCGNSRHRGQWGNCVPLPKRCDGYPDCANGKDELDCNIITHSVEEREMFTVGYTTGYLHRNWRGRWYPTCTASKPWANDACRAEIGDENSRDFPVVEPVFLQQNYNGPYIVQLPSGEIQIVQSCSGKAVFVNCPKMLCGTRVSYRRDNSYFGGPYDDEFPPRGLNQMLSDVFHNYKSEVVKSKDEADGNSNILGTLSTSLNDKTPNATNTTDEDDPILSASRVVGGRPSQPRAWPSLVAINRDGNFHCGGIILDEMWILTAAHCIDGYHRYYYDIQSGILRRFSHSPMEQSRKVTHVVMYPSYDRTVMKNDIALLRLESPLNFNRWVRPACLPEINTAGEHWRTGPVPDTPCVSAGWGSTVEYGPDPDHLREVELPILPNCKYLVDQNDAEICAGMPQGGRDTCQGDSGGPLMCRNPNSPSQWYVAGIVSHGEGCARPDEPGAYTKVSRFVEWINDVRRRRELPEKRPLRKCPGYYCHSGSRRCYPAKRRCDKSVDCMDAEDELNCQRLSDFSLFKSTNSQERSNLSSVNPEDTLAGEKSKDEIALTERTTADSSTDSATNDESSNTSIEMTTTQLTITHITEESPKPVEIFTNVPTVTTTEPIEETKQQTTTMEPVEILTTISMSTVTEPTEQTKQQTTTMTPEKNFPSVPPVQKINTTLPSLPPTHFSCTILMQTIDLSKRCDKIVDCEDGTDEEGCTCKDYLTKIFPASICDGHIDCHDGSDEENCAICSPDEFQCKRSRECVPLDKRCNVKGDCEFNEDELGCLTLTNGKYVITDIDGLPHHNKEGILTSYENGKWVPFCIDRRGNRPATLAKQMCSYFGFVGCESFNETRMSITPLEVRASSATDVIPYEYSSLYSSATDEEPRCTALYLRCLPTIHTVPLAYRVKAIAGHDDDTFLWPWHAAVFVDGRYKCSAVLLEPSWLLTSVYCTDNVDLNQNYTAALLGVSRSYLQVDGPHQQMSPVDEIKSVKNSDAVLLHLKYPANMTRHVQPMYLQKRTHAPAESDTCATVGVDKEERTRTIFLKAVIHDCPNNHRCYKNASPKKCENETMMPWSGTVVCFGCSGWYPAAIYHKKAGPCSFSTKQSLSSIDYINTNLITGMQETVEPSMHEPKCNGFRCPLGKCIESKKVCDGVPHCRDGADENINYCQEIKYNCANSVDDTIGCNCAQSELRCANGQCVPKSAFCDGEIDCSDGTDEPLNCNCAAYLKLTAPEKICDGRRHCFDKSDESPDSCRCKDASFKCDGSGDICVPQDFVCDGQPDCPSAEDEKHCQTLKSLSSDQSGYGEVIERSSGVWHSRCFPAGALSENNLENNLCIKLGYSYANNITESDSSGPKNPPVVPILDKFYMVRLNPRTWIVMRDDKDLVSLHPPLETCYRHYVTCA